MVNIALGTEPRAVPAGDADGDGEVTVDEIIIGVNNLLDGCPAAEPTPTVTVTATPTPTKTPTGHGHANRDANRNRDADRNRDGHRRRTNGVLSVAEAVARDADGKALHLDRPSPRKGWSPSPRVSWPTTSSRSSSRTATPGSWCTHQSSADVDAFQPGQRLRVTGVIRQQDPTSDSNPATGTVAVDITTGSWTVLSDGNPLPDPQPVTLATLNASGTNYTGSLVRVHACRKSPATGPRSAARARRSRSATTRAPPPWCCASNASPSRRSSCKKLNAIGNGAFTLTGIVVQDDDTDDGTLLSGFEIWERGADDVVGGSTYGQASSVLWPAPR